MQGVETVGLAMQRYSEWELGITGSRGLDGTSNWLLSLDRMDGRNCLLKVLEWRFES